MLAMTIINCPKVRVVVSERGYLEPPEDPKVTKMPLSGDRHPRVHVLYYGDGRPALGCYPDKGM